MKGVINIAHIVTCYYCSTKFDRDKVDHVKVGARRYGHAACAKRVSVLNNEAMPEVIAAGSTVTCHFCKKSFNKEQVPYEQLSESRFAHKTCFLKESTRERTDEEKLYDYLMDLYHTDFVLPNLRKQVNDLISEYKYTHSGIHKALVYWHKIKGNPIDYTHGLAIVPFIYKDAYNYYYAIWVANTKNVDKNIADYVPKVREVHILPPERKVEKRKLFTFLDEEVEI